MARGGCKGTHTVNGVISADDASAHKTVVEQQTVFASRSGCGSHVVLRGAWRAARSGNVTWRYTAETAARSHRAAHTSGVAITNGFDRCGVGFAGGRATALQGNCRGQMARDRRHACRRGHSCRCSGNPGLEFRPLGHGKHATPCATATRDQEQWPAAFPIGCFPIYGTSRRGDRSAHRP